MDKQLRITLLLLIDSAFAIIELVSGYAVHSLALVADSFHMFNDILSLVVALWAVKASKSGASATFSYGLQRAEILGALVNAVFLLALCVTIFLEAIQRFVEPQEITNPVLILVVGCFGLLSNLVGLVLFNEHGHSHGGLGGHSHGTHEDAEHSGANEHGHEHGHGHGHSHGHGHDHSRQLDHESQDISALLPESVLAREEQLLLSTQQGYGSTQHNGPVLRRSRATSVHNAHEEHNHRRPKPTSGPTRSMNMEGVFLHVLGDALGNVGVIITALFIWKTNFWWRFYCDPLVSLFITAIIFSSALPLCMRASKVLLQATPSTVNGEEVAQDIQSLPGVEEIHDLHIWQLSEDQLVATLHVTVNSAPADFPKLATTIQECLSDYGIPSITIQPEFSNTADSRSGVQPLCRAKSSNNLNAA